MRFTTFASGSSGNCALLSAGDTHILFDAGISMKRIRMALEAQLLTPQDISALFITHAHNDHIAGLRVMSRRCVFPAYASPQTAAALRCAVPEVCAHLHEMTPEIPVELGGVTVTAFPTMHDSPGSVGYVVRCGETSFGLCTDLGCVTDEVHDALMGVDAAFLEANHDLEMLWKGPYPYPLKHRIVSQYGHLSNEQCGALAAQLVRQGTGTIVLGHLSKENNLPALALKTVRSFLPDAFPLLTAPADMPLSVEFGEDLCLE